MRREKDVDVTYYWINLKKVTEEEIYPNTHFNNINKTTEDKTFSNDCFNAHKENISNMFRSIEVWIADQKKGQHYKQIKEGLNTLEDSEQKGFNELSWEVTLRPKNNIRIRDSLWV